MSKVDLNALLAQQRKHWAKHCTQMNRILARQMAFGEPMSLVCACGAVTSMDADICPNCQESLDEAIPMRNSVLRAIGLML